jgi:hypothetical protein
MTIAEHINWWKEDAVRTWETAIFNKEGGQYIFALFAFRLTIEKLLKAIGLKTTTCNIRREYMISRYFITRPTSIFPMAGTTILERLMNGT